MIEMNKKNFFILEKVLGPIWVWLIIKEQHTVNTIIGGI